MQVVSTVHVEHGSEEKGKTKIDVRLHLVLLDAGVR